MCVQIQERLRKGEIADEGEMADDIYMGELDELRPERPDEVTDLLKLLPVRGCFVHS